jgi:tetratricopeptide (TPR) repeat protein
MPMRAAARALDGRGGCGTLDKPTEPAPRPEGHEGMADTQPSRLPTLTADQRRAAAKQFERANQVLTSGDLDYAAQLFLNCCTIDPANATYRQALRQTQKGRFQNNGRGQALAGLRSLGAKWRLRKAVLRKDYVPALGHAEQILMRNPWDRSTNLIMARVFDELGLGNLAVWTLEQRRAADPHDPRVNRPLARLYEKRGQFSQAIALWELIRRAVPTDLEAQHKVKDLAASATIAKGRYEQAVQGDAPTPLLAGMQDTKTEHEVIEETQPNLPNLPPGHPQVPREVANLEARIKAEPTNAAAYLHLAGFYRRADQFDRAREVLQQGLAATGNDFEVGQEQLDLDIEPFRRDLAVAEERLRHEPHSVELQRIRAGLVKEINSRELEYYRRRSDRFPTDVPARFELALRLLRAGQIDEAIRDLQAIRSDPRYHGKVQFYLALGFKNRNNWRLAQRNFEESLTHLVAPGDLPLRKEALYQLAVGCAEAGDLPRAVDLACDLVNLDFGYKNISELLDTWQAKVS